MAGDFDVSDEDYAADVRHLEGATPPQSPPEVEDAPRDHQPARLSGEP